jgi:hypothetical protein
VPAHAKVRAATRQLAAPPQVRRPRTAGRDRHRHRSGLPPEAAQLALAKTATAAMPPRRTLDFRTKNLHADHTAQCRASALDVTETLWSAPPPARRCSCAAHAQPTETGLAERRDGRDRGSPQATSVIRLWV